jgi:hypothetical protein
MPDDVRHPLMTAQCSLCGILHPVGLMVPDGGHACADIRWYCKDARSCTDRWTTQLRTSAPLALPPADGQEIAAEQRPDADLDEAPAERVSAA